MTTVLLHVNVEVPDDFANATPNTVARELSGVLDVGVDEEHTPILYSGACSIVLAEAV